MTQLNAGKRWLIEWSANLTPRGHTLHKRLGTRPKTLPPTQQDEPPLVGPAVVEGGGAGKTPVAASRNDWETGRLLMLQHHWKPQEAVHCTDETEIKLRVNQCHQSYGKKKMF